MLATLALEGCIVTIDAMGTQASIAQAIRDRGADYILAVKNNQPNLAEALRDFFEIDSRYIALAALRSLADDGALSPTVVRQALVRLGIDPDKPDPRA